MVKVKKIDTVKPKPTKLYWGALLLSWVPFVGAALALNGLIRSLLKAIKSIKAKKIDKRAVAGSFISSFALLIGVVMINVTLNPTPTVTLAVTEANTDDTSYTLTGEVANMEAAVAKLTINDVVVPLSGGKFSYEVDLEEGDNEVILIAVNENGETKKTISIYRTTQADFAARAEAKRLEDEKKARIAKEKAEAEAKKKAEAAKQKAAAEEKKKAEAAKRKAEEKAKIAKAKAEAEAKKKAKAKARAEHRAYIDGLASTYCSNHQGNRNIYTPSSTSRNAWQNPNKNLLTKYPTQSNCVTIMTFFVDTMPSDYLSNITKMKVGVGMNSAEVLAAWGWPDDSSSHTSSWGSSGTWMWNTGTCYYGVCSGRQYVTFYDGIVTGTGNI